VTAAALGTLPSEKWSALMEGDSFQRANALYVRRSVRLQQGDWEGAEELRKQAEQFALEAPGRQMFTTSIFIELTAHTLARDLVGTKQIIDRIEPLARKFEGWAPWKMLAQAELERIRGNLVAARGLYEKCVGTDVSSFGRVQAWWPTAASGYVETLVELGHYDEARAFGLAGIDFCKERDIRVPSHGISRALAIAEARLGDYRAAAERLEAVIAEQQQHAITGLQLGASYEARARIAIWAGDREALAQFGRLTATEYRYGRNSPLGARYERLMNEAGRAAAGRLPNLAEFSSTTRVEFQSDKHGGNHALGAMLAMQGTTTLVERAARALEMLCSEQTASGGQLYALRPGEGPELLASQAVSPNDELATFLSEHVERTLNAWTTIVDVPNVEHAMTTALAERFGVTHAPVFLIDEHRKPVALALLFGTTGPSEPPYGLAAALGPYLVGEAKEGESTP